MEKEKELKEQLGRVVREHRESKKLTQLMLANNAGLTPETISRIERGEISPSLETLLAIAEALGKNLSDLLTFADSAPRRGTFDREQLLKELPAVLKKLSDDDLWLAYWMFSRMALRGGSIFQDDLPNLLRDFLKTLKKTK